jgi:hypothetical protein
MSDRSGQQIAILTTNLVVAKFRERLAVINKNAKKSYGEVQSQEIKRGRG